jgi:signal transduction histidine kinase
MASNAPVTPVTNLAEIVITPQLQLRPGRITDPQIENEAFQELADHLAREPVQFLDRLVEVALRLCEADTVGISVEQIDGKGERVFRWVAMAGELKQLTGGTTPRNFSPCGLCIDQNRPLLMDRLDRYYPYFKDAPLPFVEALLLPWQVAGGPIGTLWIVAHSDRRKFDQQDLRLMTCLAAFATGGIRLNEAMREAQRTVAAAQVVSEMAHHINNPLQAAVLALFRIRSKDDLSPDVCEMVLLAERELQRVAALSAELLRNLAYPRFDIKP